MMKHREAAEQEAAIPASGAGRDANRVDADDSAPTRRQRVHACEPGAAQADDANVRIDVCLEDGQREPFVFTPDRLRDRHARNVSLTRAFETAMAADAYVDPAARNRSRVGLRVPCRPSSAGGIRMHSLRRDVRYGIRSLRKSPGVALVAVLALTLGIGLTTTMFSIVYGALMKGLPYPDGDRVAVIVRSNLAKGIRQQQIPIQDFLDYR